MKHLCSYCGGHVTLDLEKGPEFTTAVRIEIRVATGQVMEVRQVCRECMIKSKILAIYWLEAQHNILMSIDLLNRALADCSLCKLYEENKCTVDSEPTPETYGEICSKFQFQNPCPTCKGSQLLKDPTKGPDSPLVPCILCLKQ